MLTRTVETVDSLDELCITHCTPVNADALSAISLALHVAWANIHAHAESDRHEEVLIDVPL
ncbi:hypothetical protein H3H36_02460 [Duganella sp. FT3S]|uniref:Uncharacterized protein n=1 Tax=Rugamonas fusca TaxID=2758568 RepID=A0A7W2EE28_9BURK|nr:hypothetical protein [Rugamonas fusca]MBA5604223.1 hypothetical protein [Rugamonas fusca]